MLDDFADGAAEITVRGIAQEMVERMHALGLAVYPPPGDRVLSDEMWRRWSRWGLFDLYDKGPKKSIVYAVAFDPDGWKRVSNDLVAEAGVDVRLHSWYSAPIMEGDTIAGVVCETKTGPQAVLGDVVIDASGDADVAASAGAPFVEGSYMVTTVFRLGNVDTEAAERFEHSEPAECHEVNRAARRILGGSWAQWWLKTPLPGVVWCNCPHMNGYDGLSVEDLTAADREGRQKIAGLLEYVREHYPGFEKCGGDRCGAPDRGTAVAPHRGRVRRDQGRRGGPGALRRQRGPRPRLLHPVPGPAAAARGATARGRSALLGDSRGPETVQGDTALHVDGRGRGRGGCRGPGLPESRSERQTWPRCS